MSVFKKIIIELVTCPDNKTLSTAKVAFWLILFGALGLAGYIAMGGALTLQEFTSSMATLFGIGSAPVIAEEVSDRKGGMKDQVYGGKPIDPEDRNLG